MLSKLVSCARFGIFGGAALAVLAVLLLNSGQSQAANTNAFHIDFRTKFCKDLANNFPQNYASTTNANPDADFAGTGAQGSCSEATALPNGCGAVSGSCPADTAVPSSTF